MTNKCTLIGCGGMGINIVKRFLNKGDDGFANLDIYMLDTSRSNIPKEVNEDHIYLFDGLDGSGKLRSSNYATIAERSREILQKVKPSDLTILVHSASGGSGSVIGPVLVSELMKKDTMVIVVTIGSSDSRIEAENSIKTLKSYAVIADKHNKPVNVIYSQNTETMNRGAVDKVIETNIILSTLFFSGDNRELDKSDLRNFLNYDRVTSYKPMLTLVDFFSGKVALGKDQSVVTAVTLIDDETQSTLDTHVEYQAVGFIPSTIKSLGDIKLPLHMVTISNYFNDVITGLDNKLKQIDEARSAVVHKTIVNRDEAATDLGIVL